MNFDCFKFHTDVSQMDVQDQQG